MQDKIKIYPADRVQHDIGIEDGKIFIEDLESVKEGKKEDIYNMVKYLIAENFSVETERRQSKKKKLLDTS